MSKKRWSVTGLIKNLLVGSAFVALSSSALAQIQGKFAAEDGRTLLILGQDLGSVKGYVDSGRFPEIGGVTNYTNVYDFAGLDTDEDYGSGRMNLQDAIDTYPNSVLSIGLWMVEDNDGVGVDHPNGLTELVNGVYDSSLQRFADFANRNDPHPIFLRIGYEFDGGWNNYDPTKYKNAFRYIRDFLDARGVTNVAYVFQSATWVNTGTNFDAYYPGDEYVDWMGLSFFFLASDPGNSGNLDELEGMLQFARSHNKPLQMSEVSAQYHDFQEGKFHPFDNPGNPRNMTGQEAWQQYFEDQLLPFVKNNSDVIRQVAYINADWQSQPQWKWPDAGNGFWGDTRIETDNTIATNWANEISDTSFWLHGGPTLFRTLGIDGPVGETPTPTPTVTSTPDLSTPTPTGTPDPNGTPRPDVTVEAESGTLSGSARLFDDSAASGGQGVAFISELGAGFTLSNFPSSDALFIRYASQQSGQISIRVNGEDIGNVSFTGNGVWTGAYAEVEVTKEMLGDRVTEGSSIEIFFDNGDSAMNVDTIRSRENADDRPPTPQVTATPTITATPTVTPTATPTPDVTDSEYVFIVHKPTKLKLHSCSFDNGTPVTAEDGSIENNCVQWKQVAVGDFFHLLNRNSEKHLKPDTAANGSLISLQPNHWVGNWTQWSFVATDGNNGHLRNRATGKHIFIAASGEGQPIVQQPSTWSGDFTRYELKPVVSNSTPTPTVTPTATPTPVCTGCNGTPTPTPTVTVTPTVTATPTATPTITATPTTTPTPTVTPGSVTVEAETATLQGIARLFDDSAASGGQGVAFISEAGAGMTLNNAPAADTVRVRYASQNTGTISLRVNGSDAGNLSFTGNGVWTGNYSEATATVNVPSGASFEIFFESGDAAMNVDTVEFIISGGGGGQTPTPTPTATPTDNPGGVQGKFVPPDGRTLMIVGQDLLSVTNYVNSSAPTPGGVTTYIAFYDILNDTQLNGGLGIGTNDQPTGEDRDWGGGPLNALSSAIGFPESTLQIGLNIAEGNNGSFWCQGCLAQLANGQRDAEINQLADFFLQIPDTAVYLRVGYEFDGTWNNGYEVRQNYINAYRRIVDVLRGRNVNNVAYVWQSSSSPVDDAIENGNRENIEDWYPGNDYVDWLGLSWFLLPNEQGPAAVTVADQVTLSDEVLSLARREGKPVMIAEATPQGYDLGANQNCNISPVWDGASGQGCQGKNGNQIWNEWFVPFFNYIHDNDDVIKAVSYINANWNEQGLWRSPFSQGYWGDTRVEANGTVLNNWNAEVGNSSFWINGSSNINNDVGF